MVGWHCRLHGHELSKLRKIVKDREGWNACFSPWGHKESDTT